MNGKQHRIIGGVAGPAICYAISIKENRQPSFAEISGWIMGGVCGAKLPDIFEPATHPGHRKGAHSGVVLFGCLASLQNKDFNSATQCLREQAVQLRANVQFQPENSFFNLFTALFLEFLASFLQALPVGYASHLLADATTPKGIPLI